jgi:type III secretory pathway component EscU
MDFSNHVDTFSYTSIIILHDQYNFLRLSNISYIALPFSYVFETISYVVITHFLTMFIHFLTQV